MPTTRVFSLGGYVFLGVLLYRSILRFTREVTKGLLDAHTMTSVLLPAII